MSKEGHGINLEMFQIRWFLHVFSCCGELGRPLDCSLGSLASQGRPGGETGRLWTSKGAPEELQEHTKRGGGFGPFVLP